MDEIEKSLQNWGQQLENVHLPRWHELPDIELYMDQVITLIEKYLSPLITPTMTAGIILGYTVL